MGYFEYVKSRMLHVAAMEGQGNEFYSLLMAAMRAADTYNLELLEEIFPATLAELRQRYNAPGGYLPGEEEPEGEE